MKNVFGPDSPAMAFLRRLMSLVQLNLCWALCCVPLVSIGASTVSLYGTVAALEKDWQKGEESVEVFSCFFRLFRREFRQSTLLMLVKLGALAVLLADFRIANMVAEPLTGVLSLICWIPAVLAALVNGFVYPVQAKFANTLGATLKNAALIAFSDPAVAISAAVFNAIPLGLLLKRPELFVKTSFLWLLLGVAVIAWCNWKMMDAVFQKYYTPEEVKE